MPCHGGTEIKGSMWKNCGGRGGVVVSMLGFRSEGRWFDAQSLPCVVSLDKKNFTPHSLSPPRCINGYRRHTAADNPAMD